MIDRNGGRLTCCATGARIFDVSSVRFTDKLERPHPNIIYVLPTSSL